MYALAVLGVASLALARCSVGVPKLSARKAGTDAGDADAPSTGDTGPDAPQAGDTGVDAPPSEAGPDAPATTDSGPDGQDSAPAGYCASLSPTPGFCADFDTGALDSQFSFDHTAGTGSLSADATTSVSPPDSFAAKLGKSSTNTGFAFMTRVFSGTATQFKYGFELRLDGWPGGPAAGVLAAIVIDDGAADSHTLSLYVTGTYAALEESFATTDGGMAYLDHKLNWTPTLGVWTHVAFSVDLSAKTCSVTVNGKADLTGSALDPSWKVGPPAIDLGWSYVASQSAAWVAHYDNVVATWK